MAEFKNQSVVKHQEQTQRRPKVLMFGWEFPPFIAGGLGAACYGLVKALIKRGYDITLILPKNITQQKEEGLTIFGADYWDFCLKEHCKKLTGSELETIRINSPLEPYSGVSSPLEFANLSKEAVQGILKEYSSLRPEDINKNKDKSMYGENLIQEVNTYNKTAALIANSLDFDVIHCHDWLTFGAGAMAKEISGKPLICHVHATEKDRSPGNGNPDVRYLEQLGCDRADQVIAVSNYTKGILHKDYGISEQKIDILHNGIELKEETRIETRAENEAPKVLFLGRVTYQKGPNYFLDAAQKVLQYRPDAQFVVAGNGDMLPYLKGRAYELGIQDKVEFTGMLKGEQVKEAYKRGDCYVLSSVSEPFGLTVLEALSHRLPVIMSRQCGANEVLKHVLRYDFWDVERLASLILSVLSYPKMAREIKDRCLDDLYPISWDNVAAKMDIKYKNVFSKALAAI
ncbi:MAG TPA: glycosyltransferase family 4 protein [Vampirovibrionales bacterium]